MKPVVKLNKELKEQNTTLALNEVTFKIWRISTLSMPREPSRQVSRQPKRRSSLQPLTLHTCSRVSFVRLFAEASTPRLRSHLKQNLEVGLNVAASKLHATVTRTHKRVRQPTVPVWQQSPGWQAAAKKSVIVSPCLCPLLEISRCQNGDLLAMPRSVLLHQANNPRTSDG